MTAMLAAAAAGGGLEHPITAVAPMIDVSHRDFRQFMRLLTRRAQLWTEMIKDDAVVHNVADPARIERLIGYDVGSKARG
eukprot:gene30244-2038_t